MKNMKNMKKQTVEKLHIDSDMRPKVITHIILEGANGVGKSTLVSKICKKSEFMYGVYTRGELSNFVYAKIYNRPFVSLQRKLPFIYVLLTCDKAVLKQRILERGHGKEDIDFIEKVDEQDLLIEAAEKMKNDFHIIRLDTTKLTADETAEKILRLVKEYQIGLNEDLNETDWNRLYRQACEKLGLSFSVKSNQPYINGKLMMSESTLQNGLYETFADKKTFPDNLLFSLTYDETCPKVEKIYDFAYIINSKIGRRPEMIDYYFSFLKNKKTCLVSEKVAEAFNDNNIVGMEGRHFGNDFIKELAKAKATVYCARDLEYLKLQTARLYEAIIADQIVFIDERSDLDNDMLRQIYGDSELATFLRVNPDNICEKYDKIMSSENLQKIILSCQKQWYHKIRQNLLNGGCFTI